MVKAVQCSSEASAQSRTVVGPITSGKRNHKPSTMPLKEKKFKCKSGSFPETPFAASEHESIQRSNEGSKTAKTTDVT